MGIPSIAAGQDDMVKYGQRVPFTFNYTTGNWGNTFAAHSAWTMNLNVAGAFPTLDGAPRICTSATPGALRVQAPLAGSSLYVVGFDVEVPSTSTGMTLVLLDRICDIQATEGAAPFASGALDATSKIAAGETCVCLTEVSATTSTSVYATQYNYTNQANAANNSTYSPKTTTGFAGLVGQLMSYSDGSQTYTPSYAPLSGTDAGMRTLTSITLPSGSVVAPGAITYSLCRVINTISIPNAGTPECRDFLTQNGGTPIKLRDDPCLTFLILPQSTAPDGVFNGYVNLLSAP